MPLYSVKLLARKEVAEKTTAFFFEKPKGFKFTPGQFIELYLSKDLIHAFSIASSPEEKELMIATRMRPTKFKKFLGKLKIEAKVKIEGPFGQFVFDKNSKAPAVFLAGGIGITPFRSMIKSFSNRKITLFYSNRVMKDAPFLEELTNLEKQNKNFKLVATMTKSKNWPGQKKHIDSKMIKENVKDWRKVPIGKANRGSSISQSDIGTIYYVAGSTGFVQAMADMLANMKIKRENIKTENFSGY